MRAERLEACRRFLRPLEPLSARTILEIGANRGSNVPYFIEWGFRPEQITINDIRPAAIEQARQVLPPAVHTVVGDGGELRLTQKFDVIYLGTVFSSILVRSDRERVAAGVWRLVKVGGGILWYDFVYNNPWNPDVRGVTLRELHQLFPSATIASCRVTLAPPLSRRSPLWLYHVLRAVPWLRTHRVCWLAKVPPTWEAERD